NGAISGLIVKTLQRPSSCEVEWVRSVNSVRVGQVGRETMCASRSVRRITSFEGLGYISRPRDLPDRADLSDLFGPDEHLRAAAIGGVDEEAGTASFEIVDREVNTFGIDVDAVVVEERQVLRRRHAQQPERNRNPDELTLVLIVGQHAQRFEL